MALFVGSAIGTVTLQPLLMENLLNYPVQFAGLVMAPRGIASACGMALTPRLVKYFDARLVIFVGALLCATSTIFFTRINLEINPGYLIWSSIIQGFGMGLFFVPLSTLTFQGLNQSEYAEAAGLFNFWRSLGTSIGVSVLGTILTRESQANWNALHGYIQPFSMGLHTWLAQQHTTLQQPLTLSILNLQLAQQSSLLGFIDAFYAVIIGYALMLPLLLCMKKAKKPQENP